MECAAVDGRGGAVHSHRALYAPLRTPDGELRRAEEKKFNLRWGRGRHDEEPEEIPVPIRIYHRVSFARNALFAEFATSLRGYVDEQEAVLANG